MVVVIYNGTMASNTNYGQSLIEFTVYIMYAPIANYEIV